MDSIKNKMLRIDSVFLQKEDMPSENGQIENIMISGYASTNAQDRASDVILADAWKSGMDNYLKNPIILAYHDHSEPIGRMVEHKVDSKGLWIKARISSAAEDVFNLVKDGVLTAFSVGFMVLDAEYDSLTDIFVIKELELREISVVSVPCNQDTLFGLSKSFDNVSEYNDFKLNFLKKQDESAKGLEESSSKKDLTLKEIGMDPKELEQLLAKAAADAAAKAVAAQEEARKAAEAEAAAKLKAEEELQNKIKAAVSGISLGASGEEKLLAEIEKRVNEKMEGSKKSLEDLQAAITEKAAELIKLQNSKMNFSDKKGEEVSYAEKEKAVLLSKISRKSIEDTKFGKDLLVKALGAGAAGSPHLPTQTWEHEVSLNMENEVRRRLVVAPLVRSVNMQTNVMTFPLNPEAGYGAWIGASSSFGTTTSAGNTQTHTLKEVTLNAYKVATNEYLNFEEEEDSLIVILPIVRDAMVRRLAKTVDRAFLYGAGAGSDPVRGLAVYDATSVVTPTNTGVATVANLRALRKDLGAWGLDPAELVYVVSTEVYYDLLDDTLFQTVDKVGSAATLLTGQVGSIGNTPVLVSGEFPTKAGGTSTATTNIGAICVAPGNFIVGNQRGLRFDTQDLVETQRRVLVASLRTGMTQVTTNLGMGVSTLRWS